ncbi:MAG: DoxX family protein [Waddliaceae bacterium]
MGPLRNFYQGIISIGNFLQSFLLLAMRLFWGFQFFQAGYGKLQNIGPVANYFSSLGVPFAEFTALALGWIECIGGICLFLGFASRLIVIPLACVMISALFFGHREAALGMFSNPQTFISQTPFTYLLTTIIVFCFGPGKISIDSLFKKLFFRKSR